MYFMFIYRGPIDNKWASVLAMHWMCGIMHTAWDISVMNISMLLLLIRHVMCIGHALFLCHGPLTRYVRLQVAHAPGMPGTFPSAADFKGNRYLAIPACITARAWRTCRDACRDRLPAVTGKTFPAFPAHAHPQFCVSGKRPIVRKHGDFLKHKVLSNCAFPSPTSTRLECRRK